MKTLWGYFNEKERPPCAEISEKKGMCKEFCNQIFFFYNTKKKIFTNKAVFSL